MFKARIKFYADTPKGEKNKYFCWNVESILKAEERLIHFFRKGFDIRAAWFENINTETGAKENLRFNLTDVIDRALNPAAQKSTKEIVNEIIDSKFNNSN